MSESVGKELRKWGDDQQYFSEKLDATTGPTAVLLSAPADPLGAIAACALMYTGRVVRNLADVTDDERRHYLAEMQKTALAMPLETVQLHFLIEGVTRSFTHQQVRQRTAAYAQESMRFAVVDDGFADRVALPPSIAGTEPGLGAQGVPLSDNDLDMMSREERWREFWDAGVDSLETAYKELVNSGMPAEEARGLLPHNITTRDHYITNLRNFQIEAGKRLCTQAQFEWRLVLARMAQAIREYGRTVNYKVAGRVGVHGAWGEWRSSEWQYNAIADLLAPSCYLAGKCPFKADFDRRCSIRERVDANARHNIPSSEWGEAHEPWEIEMVDDEEGGLVPTPVHVRIERIRPGEWLLNPGAAR